MQKTPIALLIIVALMGCEKFSAPNADRKSPELTQKITIAYTSQPQSTLVHVAVAKGYFADEGLNVQPQIYTYGKLALQAVIENKADFATVAETPIMFSVLEGRKIFVLANIEASTENNGIVARKDAGISAPGDLKGKRVGFTPRTTSDFFLDSLLTANGLTRKEIQPVVLNPEEMQDAILAKKVDAVCTWNYPLTEISQKLGSNGKVFYDRAIYTETFNIAALQDFVRKNPETVTRILRALIKAEHFVAKNSDEAQAIVAVAIKKDKSLIREVWNGFTYRVVLNDAILVTLEDETRWAINNKLTDRAVMPDYMEFIYSDSLKAINPEAVLITR